MTTIDEPVAKAGAERKIVADLRVAVMGARKALTAPDGTRRIGGRGPAERDVDALRAAYPVEVGEPARLAAPDRRTLRALADVVLGMRFDLLPLDEDDPGPTYDRT